MPVNSALQEAISSLMALKRNKGDWMTMQPDMQGELSQAYEGQMGQLKSNLSDEARNAGAYDHPRPDYPGGRSINTRKSPSLIGGSIGKITNFLNRDLSGEQDRIGFSSGNKRGLDEEFNKQRQFQNDEAARHMRGIEYRQQQVADEMTWLHQNKEHVDPEVHKSELTRLMREFGELDKARKAAKNAAEGRVATGSETPSPMTMEYDKAHQDLHRMKERLGKTTNPDIKKALQMDIDNAEKEFIKRFGKSGLKPRQQYWGENDPMSRDKKLRGWLRKSMYGSGSQYGPAIDTAINAKMAADRADVTNTTIPETDEEARQRLSKSAGQATGAVLTGMAFAPEALAGTVGGLAAEDYIKHYTAKNPPVVVDRPGGPGLAFKKKERVISGR